MTSIGRSKWRYTASLCGCFLLPLTVSATIGINLDAGYLRQNATTALNTTTGGGALLLLVASGASNGQTFTTPSAGQYVAGGDVILGAAGFNAGGGTQASGTGQETFNGLPNLTYPTGVSGSAYVELRWYPSITLAAYNAGSTPSAGMVFGAYNPLVTNLSGNTTLNPDGGNLWQLPGNGNTFNLDFFTTDDQGGSQNLTEGYANFLVTAAVIPEPSVGVLSGLGLVVAMGATGMWRRRASSLLANV